MAFDGLNWKAPVLIPKSAYLPGSQASSDVLFASLVTAYASMRTRGRVLAQSVWGRCWTQDTTALTFEDILPIIDHTAAWTGSHHAMTYVDSTFSHAVMLLMFTPIYVSRPTVINARLEAHDGTNTETGATAAINFDQSQANLDAEPHIIACDVELGNLTLNQHLEFRMDLAAQYATIALSAAVLFGEVRD